MENGNTTGAGRRFEKKWMRRLAIAAVALAAAGWMLWHPKRMHSLFLAMPHDAIVASHHKGLASEWKGLSKNKTAVPVLIGLGVYDSDNIKRDMAGVHQLLFWLTGADTVAAYVPPSPYGYRRGAYIAAASHVGFKSEIMEVLWRIKWVPGLGKLKTTEKGTRYLVMEDLVNERGENLLLALDVVDGMLLATLSTQPDTVREMASAVQMLGPGDQPALAFADDRPWREKSNARHRFWVYDPFSQMDTAPVTGELSSLAERDFTLKMRGDVSGLGLPMFMEAPTFGDFADNPPICADVPDAAAAVMVSADSSLMSLLLAEYAPPPAPGQAVAYVSGKPYQGRIATLAAPALNIALPWNGRENFAVWADDVESLLGRDVPPPGMRFERSAAGEAPALYAAPAALEMLLKTKRNDMAFAEVRGGALNIGSSYGSLKNQREIFAMSPGSRSLGDTLGAWRAAHPDAVAALRVDILAASQAFNNVGSIAKLAARMMPTRDSASELLYRITVADEVLAALVPIGVVECVAERDENGVLEVTLGTSSGGR